MDQVVTLAERHRRKLDAMLAALSEVDAALSIYARSHGGRFIRYGSSATGLLQISSDIDIIADFPDHSTSGEAWDFAEAACHRHGLVPDVRSADWCSKAFLERAIAQGIVLS